MPDKRLGPSLRITCRLVPFPDLGSIGPYVGLGMTRRHRAGSLEKQRGLTCRFVVGVGQILTCFAFHFLVLETSWNWQLGG